MRIEEPEICSFCNRGTLRQIPGLKPVCHTCGMDYNAEGTGLMVKKIRVRLGFTQQEMADLYGVQLVSIQSYEASGYKQKYVNWLQAFAKQTIDQEALKELEK
jgi:DNA-binding XRE family transcriptional regulator